MKRFRCCEWSCISWHWFSSHFDSYTCTHSSECTHHTIAKYSAELVVNVVWRPSSLTHVYVHVQSSTAPTAAPTPQPTHEPTSMPTREPTITPCGADADGAWFRVTNAAPTMTCSGATSEAEGTCFTINNGTCVTDGPGDYGNSERCTIEVLRAGFLAVYGAYSIESCSDVTGTCSDYFTINSSSTQLNTASSLEGIALTSGTTIRWTSDTMFVGEGWTLCGSVCAVHTASTLCNLTWPTVLITAIHTLCSGLCC